MFIIKYMELHFPPQIQKYKRKFHTFTNGSGVNSHPHAHQPQGSFGVAAVPTNGTGIPPFQVRVSQCWVVFRTFKTWRPFDAHSYISINTQS